MERPLYLRRLIGTAFAVFALTLLSVCAALASSFSIPLPDNNPVATGLLQYTAGTVSTPADSTADTLPYIPTIVPGNALFPTTLTATASQSAPARVANSALAARTVSQSTPATGIYLALSTPSPTAPANSNVTVTLSLIDTGDTPTGSGSNLFSYGTNIGIDTTYLSFSGGFTPDPSSPFTLYEASAGTTASNLSVAYETSTFGTGSFVNATSGSPITLGSFVVHVGAGGLPIAGTTITLGSQAKRLAEGGSEVITGIYPYNNVLTGVTPAVVAPEPSGIVSAVLGVAGVGLLIVRKRRVLSI